nr:hypothetical protein [Tanacetum cinerariifolium]
MEHADKVLSMQDDEPEPAELKEVVEVVTTAKLMTEVVTAATATITAAALTFSTVLSAARRKKGVVIRDPEETATPSTIIHAEPKSKDKGKLIMRTSECLEEKAAKKQKLDEEVEELKKHLQIVPNDNDNVYTKATPLALKIHVVDYEIYTENNKPYYKIKRVDGSHQLFLSFLSLLRNFDREDLEVLWQLVKEIFASPNPKNFSDDFLLTTLGEMFEKPDIQAQIWKNQRTTQMILLVERRYPLTSFGVDAAEDFKENMLRDYCCWLKTYCCQVKLMLLDDVVTIKLRLLEHSAVAGHTQEEGIDYEEVFAPVARIEAIRLFPAYASFMGFIVFQMDVKSAFLYGTIKEEVYVCQPLGFKDPDYPNKVYKVVKELYDLCKAFKKLMKDKFQMSSIGELTFFLGLQVKQKQDGIFISQDKYVAKILRKFRLSDKKSASTPIDTKKPLLKDHDGEDVEVHTYRSMIGSLMYLTSSRPDIMFTVCACAHFQVTPKVSQLHVVKRIFRYLKGKPHLGLWYPKDSPFNLVTYSDSNYAGVSLDRKSTTRGCQFLGYRLISWQCKKQTVVATLSTEAEYVAAAGCCAQVLWIQN